MRILASFKYPFLRILRLPTNQHLQQGLRRSQTAEGSPFNSSFCVVDITSFNENALVLKLRFFAEVIEDLARRVVIL